MTFTCLSITVKFRSLSHNAQLITLGDGPTASQKLLVEDTGDRLVIAFLDLQGQQRKLIAYPMDIVHEYTADNMGTKPEQDPR